MFNNHHWRNASLKLFQQVYTKIGIYNLHLLLHFGKGYSTCIIEPVHEISNNVVCATSKDSDQPAHTRSLIRAFASRWSIL